MKTRKGTTKDQKGTTPSGTGARTPDAIATVAEAPPAGEVVLYQSPDGVVQLNVRLDGESVWLTQAQMCDLFGRDQSVVSRHIRNVFTEKEIPEESNMQKMHIASSDRPTVLYSLDTIISVGYRVKSKRGTQFRIWATRTLREHLLRGYTLNEKRLRERGLGEMEQAVALLAKTLTHHALVTDEGRAVLDVVQRYSRTWRLLAQFDERNLAERPTEPLTPTAEITPQIARDLIGRLHASLTGRGDASPLFGRERTTQLDAILGTIEQTFDAKPLYPTVQARAAHLLYFVIKDHPFADGNKRIGTLLFLEYLRRNRLLELPDGRPRLANNAMVALALLVAESEPRNKELMIRLIVNLLEGEGESMAQSVAEAAGSYVKKVAARQVVAEAA